MKIDELIEELEEIREEHGNLEFAWLEVAFRMDMELELSYMFSKDL